MNERTFTVIAVLVLIPWLAFCLFVLWPAFIRWAQ